MDTWHSSDNKQDAKTVTFLAEVLPALKDAQIFGATQGIREVASKTEQTEEQEAARTGERKILTVQRFSPYQASGTPAGLQSCVQLNKSARVYMTRRTYMPVSKPVVVDILHATPGRVPWSPCRLVPLNGSFHEPITVRQSPIRREIIQSARENSMSPLQRRVHSPNAPLAAPRPYEDPATLPRPHPPPQRTRKWREISLSSNQFCLPSVPTSPAGQEPVCVCM